MRRELSWALAVALTTTGLACGDDGDGTADGGTGTTGTDDTAGTTMGDATGTETGDTAGEPVQCYGIGGPNEEGAACTANADCASGVCTIYTDVPLNEDAVCAPMPEQTDAGCSTRVTGTLFDFATREPIAGAEVRVLKAVEAAIAGPSAPPVVMTESGDDGRIDVTTDEPIESAIAILGLAGGNDTYYPTITGLASTAEGTSASYNVANSIHDLWAVPNATLETWNTALEADAELEEYLPIGENPTIVGFVRDDETGEPLAGATVAPAAEDSEAVVRYLGDGGSFDAEATESSGVFVVFGVGQSPTAFTASVGGEQVAAGSAGASGGVLFTLILNADVE